MIHAAHSRFTMAEASESPKPSDNGKAQGKNAEPPEAASGNGKIGQTPKGNGQAGAEPSPAASPATSDGRDANGRFAKGNTEGFGNPFARQAADARKVVLDCATDEELRAVTKAMLDKAKKGDVAAAKLIFEYTIGKPTQAVEPDRLARDEMEFFKDAAKLFGEAVRIVDSVEPWLPLTMLRTCWPEVTKSVRDCMVPRLLAGLPGYDANGQPLPAKANDAKGEGEGEASPVTAANGGQAPASGGKPEPVTVANGGQGLSGGGKLNPVTGANGGRSAGSTRGAPPVTVANGGQGASGGAKPQPMTGANGGKPSANGELADVGG